MGGSREKGRKKESRATVIEGKRMKRKCSVR